MVKNNKKKKKKTINKKTENKKNKKRNKKVKSKKKTKNFFYEDIKLFLLILISSIVCLVGIFLIFFSVHRMSGFDMLPALRDKDTIIVQKKSKFKRFDILYINNGIRGEFKRVIGFPGEKIEIKNDELLVNDEPFTEKYLVKKVNEYQAKGKNFTENYTFEFPKGNKIPDGYYLVLGDNRPYTTDSREYGVISSDKIIGKAIILAWPLDRAKNL